MASALLALETKVGRHLVGEPLGQGVVGAVYIAFDPELNRHVALKLIVAVFCQAGRGLAAAPAVMRGLEALP